MIKVDGRSYTRLYVDADGSLWTLPLTSNGKGRGLRVYDAHDTAERRVARATYGVALLADEQAEIPAFMLDATYTFKKPAARPVAKPAGPPPAPQQTRRQSAQAIADARNAAAQAKHQRVCAAIEAQNKERRERKPRIGWSGRRPPGAAQAPAAMPEPPHQWTADEVLAELDGTGYEANVEQATAQLLEIADRDFERRERAGRRWRKS